MTEQFDSPPVVHHTTTVVGGDDFHGVAYHGEHSAPAATVVSHEEHHYVDPDIYEHPAEYASLHPIRDLLTVDHVHHTAHVAPPTVHLAPAVHEQTWHYHGPHEYHQDTIHKKDLPKVEKAPHKDAPPKVVHRDVHIQPLHHTEAEDYLMAHFQKTTPEHHKLEESYDIDD